MKHKNTVTKTKVTSTRPRRSNPNPTQIVNSMCQSINSVEVNDGILHVDEEVAQFDILKCTFCTSTLTDSGQRLSTELADDVCDLLSLSSTEWSKRLLYSRLCLSCYALTTETRKLRELLNCIKKKMFKISIQMQRAIRYGSYDIVNAGTHKGGLSETLDWSPSTFRAHLSIALNLAENRENERVLQNSGNRWTCVDEPGWDPTDYLELETVRTTSLKSSNKVETDEDIVLYDGSIINEHFSRVPPPPPSTTPTIAKPRKQIHTVRAVDSQLEDITFELESQPNLSKNSGEGQCQDDSDIISALTGVVVFTPNGNWPLKIPKLQLERIDSIPPKLRLIKKRRPKKKLRSRLVTLARLRKLKKRQKLESRKSRVQRSNNGTPNEQLTDNESSLINHDFTRPTMIIAARKRQERYVA